MCFQPGEGASKAVIVKLHIIFAKIRLKLYWPAPDLCRHHGHTLAGAGLGKAWNKWEIFYNPLKILLCGRKIRTDE